MTNEQKQLVQSLFHAAIAMDEAHIDAFLDLRCGDDLKTKQSVLKLLNHDRDLETSGFLEQSPNALPLPKTDHTSLCGTRLGPWELTRHIGSGGMGDVYLGKRSQEFEQLAAIKVVRASANGDKIVQRFRKEMQFLASLGKHPRITSILDAGTTESGQPYIAMEYVDGQKITTFCDSRQLNIRSRLQLFCKACDAVQFAHQNAVLHRDIKPSNLLVTESGQPMLIDFGVAKLTANESNIAFDASQTQHQPFSPGYASPELLKGQPATTTGDVYALGVILYELLSGHMPHSLSRRSIAETVRLVCDTDPTKPSIAATKAVEVRSGDPSKETLATVVSPQQMADFRGITANRLPNELRGDLDRIVMKAVDRDVNQRYATVEQLTADIKRFLSGHPVKAQPSSFGYRAKKYIRRNAWGVAAASAFVLLLVGSVVATSRLAFVANQSAEAERKQRLLASEAAEAEREQRFRADQLAESERRQRLLAEKREKTANEIVDLFDRLLRSSDARYSKTKKQISAKELIENFARSLNSEAVDDPVVEARLLQSVASACIGSGDYPTAHEKILQAIELYSNSLGKNHPATVTATLRCAENLLLNARLKRAKKRFQEVILISKTALEDGSSELESKWNMLFCKALLGKAETEMRLNNLDEASALIEKAQPMIQFLGPADQTKEKFRLAKYQSKVLVKQLVEQNKFKEAIPIAEQQHKRTREQYGEDSIYVAIDVNQLAGLYMTQSRFDEAMQLQNMALQVFRKRLGEVHPETLIREMRCAQFSRYAKRYSEAESHFRQYDSIHRKLNRYEGPHHFQQLAYWADCLRKLKKYEEAKQVYQRCIDFYAKTEGANHKTTLKFKKKLAELSVVPDENSEEADSDESGS